MVNTATRGSRFDTGTGNKKRESGDRPANWLVHCGFFGLQLLNYKNGRVPGIRWNAPTYVTELVGYLYRRNSSRFVIRSGTVYRKM